MKQMQKFPLEARGETVSREALVQAALQEITQNYREASLSNVARTYGVSLAYVSECVRTQTGKTYKELLQKHRMETAARLLRSSLRSTDCVARLGGDEFAVLLPRCNLRDAARVLEKIRAVFRHYNEHSGNVPVIMSFGLSGAEEAPSLREALALADRRMLHEKHGSRLVSGHAIKAWIEKRKDCVVSLEESRYDG